MRALLHFAEGALALGLANDEASDLLALLVLFLLWVLFVLAVLGLVCSCLLLLGRRFLFLLLGRWLCIGFSGSGFCISHLELRFKKVSIYYKHLDYNY